MAATDAGRRVAPQTSSEIEERSGIHDMATWDWVWMTFMMGFWIVLIGAVVYIAVRLAQRPPTKSV